MHKFLALAILTLAALAASFIIFKSSDLADDRLRSAINSQKPLPAPSAKSFGALEYTNISLDEDAFSTIKEIKLTYSPFTFFFTRTYQSLEINGLRLIGEINENLQPSLAGFSEITLPPITAKTLVINDAQITLQDEKYGAITISFESQGIKNAQSLGLQSAANLIHKNLRIQGQGQGAYNAAGWWQHDFEISDATLETPELKVTRAAGSLRLNAASLSDITIEGELRSDGMSIANHPWKNASMTLQGSLANPELFLAAKSVGIDGLELGLTFANLNILDEYSGSLHGENTGGLKDFLTSQTIAPAPQSLLDQIPDNQAADIEFEKQAHGFSARIEKSGQPIELSAHANDETALSVVSKPSAFSLYHDNGPVSIKGVMAITAADNTAMNAEISKTTIAIGNIRFEDINGAIGTAIPCKASSLKIPASCALQMSLLNANPKFEALKLVLAGGNITLNAADISEQKAVLNIKDIDLAALTNALSLQDWQAAGNISGEIHVHRLQGQTQLQKASFKNDNEGVLKISDAAFLALLVANEEEKDLINMALQELRYDSLNIDITKSEAALYRVRISATGKNPALMQGRKFALDFDFETSLETLNEKLFNF